MVLIKLSIGNWTFKIIYLAKLINEIDKKETINIKKVEDECSNKDINYLIKYYFYLDEIYEKRISSALDFFNKQHQPTDLSIGIGDEGDGNF